jgi:hypothetical protein
MQPWKLDFGTCVWNKCGLDLSATEVILWFSVCKARLQWGLHGLQQKKECSHSLCL